MRLRLIALVSLVLAGAWPPCPVFAGEGETASKPADSVRFAVLAFRPKAEIAAKWQPLIDYLNVSVPGRRFMLEALTYAELEQAVGQKQVDVVLTQPAHYILLTNRDGLLSPLASLVERDGAHKLAQFGGVMLARAERHDLEKIDDLHGKRIATSQKDSLGSYQMQALELKHQGVILPDAAQIIETGQPQDKAIEALLAGKADVAFVRTGVLEAMTRKGKLAAGQLKVINETKPSSAFPLALSTRLYPEWPLAVMPWMDEELARRLAAAVLALPHDGEVARTIGITGFTIPLDYKPVSDLMRELRLPPFDSAPEITLHDVFFRYQNALLFLSAVFLVLSIAVASILFRKNRLLAKSDALFRNVFQLSPVAGSITTIADGRYLVVNQAYTETFGWSDEEMLQNSATKLGLWLDLNCRHQWLQVLEREGVTRNYPARMRHRDGRQLDIMLYARPIDSAGESCILTLLYDITERLQKDAELEQHRSRLETLVAQRTEELAKATRAAETANRAKGSFLANMSHEIRTPMNAIIGLTHLMQRANRDAEQADRLRKVDSAAALLLALINDVLDLSKIEAGKLVLEETDFQLSSILDSICSLVSYQAKAKGLSLHIDAGDVPQWLRGDPLRLRQALINYTGNALKFTRAGSITLRARLLADDGEVMQVRFEVIDTGPGIAHDKLGDIFQKFEQADASITREHGGTGLGLAITRHLAELMGGSAGVESRLGEGSCFWFTAQLRHGRGAVPVRTQRSERPELELEAKHRGARLLLVDDNEVNREVAKELLSGTGLIIDDAADGQEAVNKARTTTYDLILMDMHMPRMGGLEATRAIRTLPGWRDKPILAMTANAFDDDRRACREAGMDDFVAKPVIPDTLYRVLLKWLTVGNEEPLERAAAPVGDHQKATITVPADVMENLLDRLKVTHALDLEGGLKTASGDPDKYVRLLSLFIKGHAGDEGKLLAALADADHAALKLLAHSLKGSAGYVGLVRLGELASVLDASIDSHAPADVLERQGKVLAAELALLIEQTGALQ